MTAFGDWRGDWRVESYDEVTSTSDLCIARAEAGEPAGLVVIAGRQTRARGSRGRGWIGYPGNLACSVLLRPVGDTGRPVVWPFVAGLALYETLRGPATTLPLSLKWPNDVLLDGRKLGGILVERGAGGGRGWVVIGFGANLARAPELSDRSTASLSELGPPPDPHEIVPSLTAALRRWCRVWEQNGFEPVRTAWLDAAHPAGTPLAVQIADVRTEGIFAGLDADGALLLRTGWRTVRVDTGEILLLAGS